MKLKTIITGIILLYLSNIFCQAEIFIDNRHVVCNMMVYEDYLYYEYVMNLDSIEYLGTIERINLNIEDSEPEIIHQIPYQFRGFFIEDGVLYYTYWEAQNVFKLDLKKPNSKPVPIVSNLFFPTEIEVVDSKLLVSASLHLDSMAHILCYDLENLNNPPKILFNNIRAWTIDYYNSSYYISSRWDRSIYRAELLNGSYNIQKIELDSIIFPVGIEVIENFLFFTDATGSDSFGHNGKISMINLNDPNNEVMQLYTGLEGHHELVFYNNFLYASEPGYERISKIPVSIKTSTNPINKKKISIFPNPSSNVIYVRNFSPYTSYQVYDIKGNRVKIGDLDEEGKIDISYLSNGIYILSIGEGLVNVFQKLAQ